MLDKGECIRPQLDGHGADPLVGRLVAPGLMETDRCGPAAARRRWRSHDRVQLASQLELEESIEVIHMN